MNVLGNLTMTPDQNQFLDRVKIAIQQEASFANYQNEIIAQCSDPQTNM